MVKNIFFGGDEFDVWICWYINGVCLFCKDCICFSFFKFGFINSGLMLIIEGIISFWLLFFFGCGWLKRNVCELDVGMY